MARTLIGKNVLQAAQERIRWLFDEFPNVIVMFSGGKDSTVVLNLTIEEARRRGRLPVPVAWIDQEAEWDSVVQYVRRTMARSEVAPLWFQVPIWMNNATDPSKPYMVCWDPDQEAVWMRPKEPGSIHQNDLGTQWWYDLFPAIARRQFGGAPCAAIGGMRCSESMRRAVALTERPTYKGATWGSVYDKAASQFCFHPLYDWGWQDVWKAIHEHGWDYCTLYDTQFRYGVPVHDMRVSNVHHETATQHLRRLQEFEPQTWDRLVRRLGGINSAAHLGRDFDRPPKDLPPMFQSWAEYRDFLLPRMIERQDVRDALAGKFARMEAMYSPGPPSLRENMARAQVRAILLADVEATTLRNWESTPTVASWHQWFYKGIRRPASARNRFILEHQSLLAQQAAQSTP